MSDFSIIDPSTEFVAVRHSYLNGTRLNLEKAVEDALTLEAHTAGRKVVPCFEGDLVQVRETGEIILTHENSRSPSLERYRGLRDKRIVATLNEVLDSFARYKADHPEQRVVLCFELKYPTTIETIEGTLDQLRDCGLTERDVYFDSFFGGKLDLVDGHQRSLHLAGNLASAKFMVTRPQDYNVITVPKAVSIGNPGEPVIYGAVGSLAILKKVAENPQVYGAYVRIKEAGRFNGALNMFRNSFGNKEKLRQVNLTLFSTP